MTTPASDQDATARVEIDSRTTVVRSGSDAQFAPGTMIAGRYRISSLLGSGGMGEVYRADDTKLGQTVALKFLPARLARDPILLARLHDEVRLGRQVAHPNVCHLYDIVDWEGAHFVAMEYVDGEDLSRLLRRIGRLASDKAVDIARGIAAGLFAAHTKGILHRDLKPANIMIDSRGEARIMDFGLALAAGEDDGTISGTPAYMAPEQLEGTPATIESDLYALGLVMYELFTGRRAHNVRTLPERVRDLSSEITTPSSVIGDMNPAVERLILRCLESDPSRRPHSARQVIESLPGGDPLAAALAAGETPSPRIVAAAGTAGSLRPAVAWTLLLASFAIAGTFLALTVRDQYFQRSGLGRPPEAQAERATQMLRGFGIPEQPFAANGFRTERQQLAWLILHKESGFATIGRGFSLVRFWMREEPAPLLDRGVLNNPLPTLEEPAQHAEGSVAMEMDPRGRLLRLTARPLPSWPARALDWNPLLRAAGLAPEQLTPASPKLLPPFIADARAAWTGRYPEDGTPIRVEVAAFRGVPVFFRIDAPWNEDDARARLPFSETFFMAGMLLIATFMLAGVLLAWRNLRMRRGDRQGAMRMALALFAFTFLGVFLIAPHHPVLIHEIEILQMATQSALFFATVTWIVYIALEPFIRRKYPQGLISWARLVSGRRHDPMVGRDVLIGLTAGLTHSFLAGVLSRMVRHDPTPFAQGDVWQWDSIRLPLGLVAGTLKGAAVQGLAMMVALMVMMILLRRRLYAAIGFFAMFLTLMLTASREFPFVAVFVLIAALFTLVVARFGLLAIISMQFAFGLVFSKAMPDAFAWYTLRGAIPLAVLIVLALWAFRTALGDQRAFAFSIDE